MLDSDRNAGVPKPYIGNRAVQWGRIEVEAAGVVPLTPLDIQRYRLRVGDLLVCEGGEVGRAAIWKDEIQDCYFQKALHRLRPKAGYDPRLMQAFLSYWSGIGGFANYVTQTSIAHLPREKFTQMPLPVPEKSEQHAIATALEDVDRLNASLERLISKKRSVRQGMVQELLTGRTRLPGFTTAWGPVRMREIGSAYGGLVGKSKEDFGVGSARYVTFMEVMADPRLLGTRLERVHVVKGESQNAVERGDVIFNGSSETPEEVAMAAVVDFEPKGAVFLNSFCFGFRLNSGQRRVVSMYLAHWFRSSMGREAVSVLAQGATRYNIAKTKLLDLEPVLPSRDEQEAISGVLRDVDNEIEALERRLVSAREVKTGIMQELLTGRTRLPIGEDA